MAKSREFVWVKVDRDRTPDLPKHYHVSAYPTLLFLNPADEKIHRFAGFKEVPAFLAELDEALRRWALYKAGKVWDEPDPRPDRFTDTGTITKLPAPSEDVPTGIAAFGDDLFVAQGSKLFRLDRKTGKVKARLDLPPGVTDLTTDGKVLYALTGGWTAGHPIHVLAPDTGKVLREIVTEANRKNRSYGAKGIAWRDGKLYVLEGMWGRLDVVDPATGKVEKKLESGQHWLSGLGFDGSHFVTGSRDHIYLLDAATGKTVQSIPANYWLRVVAAADGAYFLMEQPIFGFDRHHARIRVWPKKTEIHRLVLPTGEVTPK